MCTCCALALDGVDDGERCVSLGTWHGYACAENIPPRTSEVKFVISWFHTCGETHVDMFVSALALHVWE